MQGELLLEIFSEEIPAKFQKNALEEAKVLMERILSDYGAIFDEVTTYISTRRLTLLVQNLLSHTSDIKTQKRGPKVLAPSLAIEGFLRTNNKSKEDLYEKDGYLCLDILTKGMSVESVLPEIIELFIEKFPWKKTMRWYLESIHELSSFWVRPIRSILCVYDGRPVEMFIKTIGITTSDVTYGHRFLSSDILKVKDFDNYCDKLENTYVMVDYLKKVQYIDIEMAKKAAEKGLAVMEDSELLYEVAGLVDYPFIHIGMIDEKFMHLPQEVLSTSMRVHQKYFTLTYPNGVIAPFYGTVTNVPMTKVIYEGLDRVLRARLSDAAFFFKEDTEISLDAFAQRLSGVIFHERLGSIGQKVDRMLSIAETKEENRAISLCKADLLTQMVGEFPELQGVMGSIYALYQEEDENIAEAIREHYKPNGASDSMPSSKIAARISFLDKLDTIVGFIGIGIYPSGSKDPFALRRAGFSIVRLICDSDFDVLLGEKLSYYVNTFCNAYAEQGIAIEKTSSIDIIEFINERFKSYVEDKLDIGYLYIDTVVNSYKGELDFDYKEAIEKAKILKEISKKEEFEILQSAYKRASGILLDEVIKEDSSTLEFENMYLSKLQRFIKNMKKDSISFEDLIELSTLMLAVCDNVIILDDNENIKKKNLVLISDFLKIVKGLVGEVYG